MNEPVIPSPCSTSPVGWLSADPQPDAANQAPDPAALRAAIELVLAHPEAVAEILDRARPAASTRHDGWTGERMAAFLETLADTGLITEACRSAGMSRASAYELRNRDPVFAAALAAAQSRARPAVSDGLLERSITGTVEHYYRDGVLVGERRHYESWLGLAVLRRLDKQAEQDRADKALSSRIDKHWAEAMGALRGGGTAVLRREVDKVDIPPGCSADLSENCWQNDDGVWMTCFPPPPGFAGAENRAWDGLNYYERECSEEEIAALEGAIGAEDSASRAEEDARRDSYFAMLRKEMAASHNMHQAQ